MSESLADSLKQATDLSNTDPAKALHVFRHILLDDTSADADAVKIKEQAVQPLCDLYVKQGNAEGLSKLLKELRGFFSSIPKAKTAKIVRSIIDNISKIPNSTQLQVDVCKEQVEWAKTEKRTFLRQRIELRLSSLYLETREFTLALGLIGTLLTEVKRLDDKLLLVDIHLIESKVHHALRNLPKARAALTAARTAANAIYVPVPLQAEIDTQSGILHAEERDYKTAYSYFFEAFEQFGAFDDKKAVSALKYMLMCKVMMNDAGEVASIISSKSGLKYAGRQVDSMKAVAKAYQDRSLDEFQGLLHQFKDQLVEDPIVHTHLSELYDRLLEQNLLRLIEPFSRVEIAHIAKLIGLPLDTVERKLSQMILDKKFAGTLDQGNGCLEVFEEAIPDKVYPQTLDIFESMGRVVDTLFARSQKVVTM